MQRRTFGVLGLVLALASISFAQTNDKQDIPRPQESAGYAVRPRLPTSALAHRSFINEKPTFSYHDCRNQALALTTPDPAELGEIGIFHQLRLVRG